MSDLLNYPLQDAYETTLSQVLTASATDLTVYVNTAPSFTFPSSTQTRAVINPGKSNVEVVKISAYSSSAKTLTIPASGRAQARYNGHTATVQAHSVGSKIIISDNFGFWGDIATAINSKLDESGGTLTGALQFSGTDHAGLRAISLTTAQRDALASPANGDIIYNTTTGTVQRYSGGSWGTFDIGTPTPNASTTVAGIIELATAAERAAGTATGATGAALVPTNDALVKTSSGAGDENKMPVLNASGKLARGFISGSQLIYGASSAGTDTYAITVQADYTAYTVGDSFLFESDVTNTGAATLNVNAIGAVGINTMDGGALITGDIGSNRINHVVYDGNVFILLSQSSTRLTPTQVTDLSDGGETTLHKHTAQIAKGTTSRAAATGSGSEAITGLGFVPRLIRIVAVLNGGASALMSYGSATSTSTDTSVSIREGAAGGALGDSLLNIQLGGTGYTANLTSIDADGFTLAWTQIGAGLAVDVIWEAIR